MSIYAPLVLCISKIVKKGDFLKLTLAPNYADFRRGWW